MSEFGKILKQASTRTMPSSPYGVNLSTVNPLDYTSQLGPNISGTPEYLNYARADAQTDWESGANFLLRSTGKALLSIPETAGHILDIPGWFGNNTEYDNALSAWARSGKEELDQILPEYSKDVVQHDSFNPLSRGWWWRNGDSVIESVGYFVPGLGVGKAVSAALKIGGELSAAARIARGMSKYTSLTKTADKIAETGGVLAMSIASNHAEGMQIAAQVYKDTFAELQGTMGEAKAKELASEAASRVVRGNMVMLIPQLFESQLFFKSFDSIRRNANISKSWLMRNTEVFKQMGLEGGEELYQGMLERESKRKALIEGGVIEDDNSTFYGRLGDYLTSDEGLTEGFLGAIGGGLFGVVGEAANMKRKARDRKAGLAALQTNKDAVKKIMDNKGKLLDEAGKAIDENNPVAVENAIRGLMYQHAWLAAETGTYTQLEEFIDGVEQTSKEEMEKNGWDVGTIAKRNREFRKILSQVENAYNQIHELGAGLSVEYMNKMANHLLNQMSSYEGMRAADEEIQKAYAEYKTDNKLMDLHPLVYELVMVDDTINASKDKKIKVDPNVEYSLLQRKAALEARLDELAPNEKLENLTKEVLSDSVLNTQLKPLISEKIGKSIAFETSKRDYNHYAKKENREAWEKERKESEANLSNPTEEKPIEEKPAAKKEEKPTESIEQITKQRDEALKKVEDEILEAKKAGAPLEPYHEKKKKIIEDAQNKIDKIKGVKNDPDIQTAKREAGNVTKVVSKETLEEGQVVRESIGQLFDKFDRVDDVGEIKHAKNAVSIPISNSKIKDITYWKTDKSSGFKIQINKGNAIIASTEKEALSAIEKILEEESKNAPPKKADKTETIVEIDVTPEVLQDIPNGALLNAEIGNGVLTFVKTNNKFHPIKIYYEINDISVNPEMVTNPEHKALITTLIETFNVGNFPDGFQGKVKWLKNVNEKDVTQDSSGNVTEENTTTENLGEEVAFVDGAAQLNGFAKRPTGEAIPESSYEYTDEETAEQKRKGIPSAVGITSNAAQKEVNKNLSYDIDYLYSSESNNDDSLHIELDTLFIKNVPNATHLNLPIVIVSKKAQNSEDALSGRLGHLPVLVFNPTLNEYDYSKPKEGGKVLYRSIGVLLEDRKTAVAANDVRMIEEIDRGLAIQRAHIQEILAMRIAVAGKEGTVDINNTKSIPVINNGKTSGQVRKGEEKSAIDIFMPNDAHGLGLTHTLAITHSPVVLGWGGLDETGLPINDAYDLEGVARIESQEKGAVFIISEPDARGGFIPLKLKKRTFGEMSQENQKKILDKVMGLIIEYRDTINLPIEEGVKRAEQIMEELSQIFMVTKSTDKKNSSARGNIVLDTAPRLNDKGQVINGNFFAIRKEEGGNVVEHRFYYRTNVNGKYYNLGNKDGKQIFTHAKYVNGVREGGFTNGVTEDTIVKYLTDIKFNVSTFKINQKGDYKPPVDLDGEITDYNTFVLKHFLKSDKVYLGGEHQGKPFAPNGRRTMFSNPQVNITLGNASAQPVETTNETSIVKIEETLPDVSVNSTTLENKPASSNITSAEETSIDRYLSQKLPSAEEALFANITDRKQYLAAQLIAYKNKEQYDTRLRGILKRISPPIRNMVVSGATGKKINPDQAKEWWNKRFPGVEMSFVHGLIDNGVGMSWGLFKDKMVTLSDEAPEGVERHEGFHVAFLFGTSAKRKQRILKEAEAKFGKPTKKEIQKYRSETAGSEKFTDEQIANQVLEEKMAEEFREYSKNQEREVPSAMRKFFDAILDFLKHIFGNPAYMQRLYENIISGNLTLQETEQDGIRNHIEVRTKIGSFNERETSAIINTLTGMLMDAITSEPNHPILAKDSNSENKAWEVILLDKINEKIKEHSINEQTNMKLFADGAYDLRKNWEEVRSNYDEIFTLVLNNLKDNYNFKIETGKIDFHDYEQKHHEYDASFLKFNPADKVNQVIKHYFMTVRSNKMNEVLGAPMYEDFNKLFPAVLRRLANKPTIQQKIKELIFIASRYDNEYSGSEGIMKLVSELETMTKTERTRSLRAKFFQSTNNYSHPQMKTVVLKTEDGLEFRNVMVSSKDFREELVLTWMANYYMKMQNEILSKGRLTDEAKAEYNKNKAKAAKEKLTKSYSNIFKSNDEKTILENLDRIVEVLDELGISMNDLKTTKQAFRHYVTDSSNLEYAKILLRKSGKVDSDIAALKTMFSAFEFGLSFNKFVNKLGIFASMEKGLSPFEGSVTGYMREFADIVTPFFLGEYDNIISTIDGETQWAINAPNQLAMFFSKLASPELALEILSQYKRYAPNSNWINDMFPNDTMAEKRIQEYKYAMHQGVSLNEEGIPYHKLNDIQRTVGTLSLFMDEAMKGKKRERFWANMPYEADKTRHYVLNVPYFKSMFSDGKFIFDKTNDSFAAFINTVKQEVDVVTNLRNKLSEVITLPMKDGKLDFDAEIDLSGLTSEQRNQYLIEPMLFVAVRNKENIYKLGQGLKFKFISSLNDVANITESSIETAAENYIKTSFQGLLESFEKEGFIRSVRSESGSFIYVADSLPSDLLEKGNYTNVTQMLLDFHINYTIAQREMKMLLTGLDGEYKDIFDEGKRMAQYGAPYKSLFTEDINKQYGNMVIDDISLSIPEKDWEAIADKFGVSVAVVKENFSFLDGKIDVNDAQGWATVARIEEILKGSGMYPGKEEQIAVLQRIKANQATQDDYLKFALNPVKGFYYKRMYDPKLNTFVSVQVKYALFPLSEQFTSGLELDKIRRKAESLEREAVENGKPVTIEIIPKSAFKVGRRNTRKIHTDDGLVDDARLEQITLEDIVKLDNDGWGIQQDIPLHELDHEQKLGVQIAKLMLSNLQFSQKVYNFRGQQLTGQEIFDIYQESISEELQKGLDELAERLKDDASLKDLLSQELIDRKKATNYLGLLETEKEVNERGEQTEEFVLPLQFNSSERQFHPLAKSLYNKVRNFKMPGGPYVQLSDAFTKMTGQRGNENGITFIDGHDGVLKMHIEKDTIYADCVLPPFAEEFVVDGKVDIDRISRECPEALEMIGYRIPTSGKSYTMVLNVVGFMNKTVAGDSIMVPFQLMKHMGFDFDVDKLYLIHRHIGRSNGTHTSNGELVPEGQLFIWDSPDPKSGATTYMNKNKIFDVFKSIIQSNVHAKEVMASGEFADLEDAAKEYSLGNTLPDGNTYQGQRLLNKRNMEAVVLKGVFANLNGFLPIAQILQMEIGPILNAEGKVVEGLAYEGLYVKTPSGNVILNRIGNYDNYTNLDGKTITDVTGQYVTAIMDAAKSPTTSLININLYTANVAFLMSALGLNFNQVAAFMQQPILRKASELETITDGFFTERDNNFSAIKVATQEFIDLIGGTENVLNEAANLLAGEGVTVERFRSNAVHPLDFDSLTKTFKGSLPTKFDSQEQKIRWIADNYEMVYNQLVVSEWFNYLNKVSSEITFANSALSSDKKDDPSLSSVHRILEDANKVRSLSTYNIALQRHELGIQHVFTYAQSPYQIAKNYREVDIQALEKLTSPSRFFLYSLEYRDAFLEMMKFLGITNASREDEEQMYFRYINGIMAYINQQNTTNIFDGIKAEDYISDKFVDYIMKAKEIAIKHGFDVFEHIDINYRIIDKNRNSGIPTIVFRDEKAKKETIDDYTAQMKSLFFGEPGVFDNMSEEEIEIVENVVTELVRYLYVTTGFVASKGSLNKIIPYEVWTDKTNGIALNAKAHAKMSASNIVTKEFAHKFVQHNYSNKRIAFDVSRWLLEGKASNNTSMPEIKGIPKHHIILSSNKKLINKGAIKKRYISRRVTKTVNGETYTEIHLYQAVGIKDGKAVFLRIPTRGIPGKAYEYGEFTSFPNNKTEESLDNMLQILNKDPEMKKMVPIVNIVMDAPENSLTDEEKLIPLPDMKGIDFQEEETSGYRNRTIKNASADATIAIAVDFTSAGEKLTKSSVLNQNKKYIAIDANNLTVTQDRVNKIVNELNSVNAKTLNIAGNGIYTMKGKYTQQQIDEFTYQLIKAVTESPNLKNKIESIRTGGQTGFDEAGAKAGVKLGIPTMILAPKGWVFRDITGKDISNEEQFKSRFLTETQPSSINIYAGTNENADLSNFAIRPFIYKGIKYNTVEGAFQAAKLDYAEKSQSYNDKEVTTEEYKQSFSNLSGNLAKQQGRKIKGLNTKVWDVNSSKIMKEILLESFKQNPEALKRLLSTGNATLTHTQDSGKWKTEFPRLLMEVREELRNQSTEQPKGLQIAFKADEFSWANVKDRLANTPITQEQWDKLTKEEQNKILECL